MIESNNMNSALDALYVKLINVLTQLRANLNTMQSNKGWSRIEQWSRAIAVQEGAKKSLNNPGNLKYSTLTASWGATKGFQATDGGWIAAFPTLQEGQTALINFLTLGAENELIAFHTPESRTLQGFSVIYAGNPPQKYIDGIVSAMGVPGSTLISTFL